MWRRSCGARWLAGVALGAVATLTLAACGDRPVEGAASGEEASSPSLLARLFEARSQSRTVPAGTLLVVAFEEGLSSHANAPGDPFRARVVQGVSVDGLEVVPAGSRLVGSVTEATAARKIGSRSRLSLEFHRLELPWGGTVPVLAAFSDAGRSKAGKDAAIIGAATLGGAVLGEAVDEGEGTVIGAIVGGIGGAVAAARTRGKAVEVAPGTEVNLRLLEAVDVEVPGEVATGARRTTKAPR